MAVLEYTRSPVDSMIKVDMKNVRASVDPSALRVYRLFQLATESTVRGLA
jgi:hypothetical protein